MRRKNVYLPFFAEFTKLSKYILQTTGIQRILANITLPTYRKQYSKRPNVTVISMNFQSTSSELLTCTRIQNVNGIQHQFVNCACT